MRVIIFDGHHLLFKYFFGMPPFIKSKDGELIHGALGAVSSVIKQMKKFHPVYPIVCFDSQEPKSKEKEFPFYKANRVKAFEPDSANNPFSQLKVILKSLDCMQVPHVMFPEYEADDVIGTYAHQLAAQGHDVIISSSDTDFLQLVNDKIVMYKERGKKDFTYNIAKVKEDFGISPEQIIDYKALIGDSADNIKGISGIGPKTAVKLLNEYGNLENTYNNLSLINDRLSKKLNEAKDTIAINRKLIKINQNCELDLPILHVPDNVLTLTTKSIFQKINVWL